MGDADKAQTLAIDDQNIYWTESEDAGGWRKWHYRLRAMAKSGGTTSTLAEGAGNMINWPVAKGGFVYWSMATCPESCDTSDFRSFIYRVPRGGGAIETLKVDTDLSGFAVDDARVYYRARYNSRKDDMNGIWSVRLDGTEPRSLANTHWKGSGPVLGGDTLYYLDNHDDDGSGAWTTLNSVSVTGGSATQLRRETGTLTYASGFPALNAGIVFVSNEKGLWRLPTDGSKWAMIWGGASVALPDANGGRVYFGQAPANGYPGCLGRANLDGTDASCLEEGDHTYRTVKVDGTHAYYQRDGQIWRRPR